ncbi:hypothetical protein ACLB2K_039417 [Fragaria x ananassa]
MQNINNNQLQEAETYSVVNQGFDFQSIPYEDFALVSDAVNSQTTVSKSQEHFVRWNSSVVNPHTDIAVNHVNPQNQESFMSWNSSTLNSQTDVAVNYDNPQSQEHFIWWNSSTQDEIVNDLPNIDQPHQSIFTSQPLFSYEKVFPSESNKERSKISKYASELGSRDVYKVCPISFIFAKFYHDIIHLTIVEMRLKTRYIHWVDSYQTALRSSVTSPRLLRRPLFLDDLQSAPHLDQQGFLMARSPSCAAS